MHAIESAKSGRSLCTTCNTPIAKGEVRVAEEVTDIGIPRRIHRYYHMRCAITVHPELVRRALDSFIEPNIVFDRADVEARIAPSVAREREQRDARYAAQLERQRPRRAAIEPDDTTRSLLALLQDDPDDAGTLAVLADQLQSRDDIRGELIAVQLAIVSSPEDDALLRRRADLIRDLSPPLDLAGRGIWGIGYIKRLELEYKGGSLAGLWDHPSVWLLRELSITFHARFHAGFVPRLAELVPKSLQTLELLGADALEVAKVIAALPRLRTLVLDAETADFARLEHPTLTRIALGGHSLGDKITQLRVDSLPAVAELALTPHRHGDRSFDSFCEQLSRGWLSRITRLSLRDGELGESGIAALAAGLDGRKLARLDLTGTPIALPLRTTLASLCDELVLPSAVIDPERELWVEHTGKPEWGRGKLVRRYDGKVEVKFGKLGKAGTKVFKIDAPFLRFG